MTHRIHDRIREILETTTGLTQKGLAERMGINPAAVNRMLYGRRNIMAEEIPMIEDYLAVRLDLSAPATTADIEYRQEQGALSTRHGFSDSPTVSWSSSTESGSKVPVYGITTGRSQKEPVFSSGNVVDWVPRHPAQFGIGNAFAIYVFSDTMEPRYFQGELIYIHPGRPPEMNRDCVIEMKNGDVHIERFLRQSEDKIRVSQFNPPKEKDIPLDKVKSVYTVVGRA